MSRSREQFGVTEDAIVLLQAKGGMITSSRSHVPVVRPSVESHYLNLATSAILPPSETSKLL